MVTGPFCSLSPWERVRVRGFVPRAMGPLTPALSRREGLCPAPTQSRQREWSLRPPGLHLDVSDAEGKGVRYDGGIQEQRQDKAKFPASVCLTECGSVARGGKERLRRRRDGHFTGRRA